MGKYQYGSTVVYTDLIDGHGATLTVDGWQITRMAKVTGGMNSFAGYAKVIQASLFLAQQGAVIGQPHPGWPTALLREISPTAISSDTVEFRLVYRDDPVLKVSCQSGLSQEDTNIAISADDVEYPIKLKYTYPADYGTDPVTGKIDEDKKQLAGVTITQGGTVQKMIPDISFSYHRTETRGWYGAIGIIELQKAYVGTINKTGWLLGGYIQAPWTWLCTGITGDSDDGGIQYQMTYTFSYRRKTWNPFACFIREDGKMAPDVMDETTGQVLMPLAYRQYQIYPETNFNDLNIDYTNVE